MKRFAWLTAVICLCVVCLAVWWDKDAPGTSSVSVDRKGRISAWFVEDFAEDYYSLGELAEMARREAAEYDAMLPDKRKAVKVGKVGMLPDGSGRIMVSYRYDGWESYADFNGQRFFYGTVEEAASAGYDVSAVLKGAADDSRVNDHADGMLWADRGKAVYCADEVMRTGNGMKLSADIRVIITDVKANIYCPGEVIYVSGGVSANADGSIDTSGAEGTVCILMK